MNPTVNQESVIRVPVLIVGGGGAGLTAAALLSSLAVPSLLVSRYPDTSPIPKAHLLNQRSMEIFTEAGVAPAILAKSSPHENMRGVGWYSTLAGKGREHDYGRRLAFIEAWGGGYSDPDYVAASACASANLSLRRLEPILKAHVESSLHATVRFFHELVDLTQDAEGVTSTVLDRSTGETYTVRSDYVLGADGGRTVAHLVGIGKGHIRKLRKMVSVYMSADLSSYFSDSDPIFRYIINPDRPETIGSGVALVPEGPDHWGAASEEWLAHLFRSDIDVTRPEEVVREIGEAIGIPDFNPTVHKISEWQMETSLADDFRAGRVFLLGDAAHRHPPTGGLGLNSAIHDAHNLCWKIASVLAGQAGDGLLDTYVAERRPVDEENINVAVEAALSQGPMMDSLGVSSSMSAEENWAALRLFWEDSPGSAEARHTFSQYLGLQTVEYRQHNTDFGYTYSSKAIIDDGTPAPVPVDRIRIYEPSSRPGHPVPHAWLERSGERIALRSLAHGGHFVLVTGNEGHDWVVAANKTASNFGIPMRTARIGIGDVDFVDIRLAWTKNREIGPGGAVLVRPDGFVAFRSISGVEDPVTVLSEALTTILHIDSK